jgi:hypothetical protein
VGTQRRADTEIGTEADVLRDAWGARVSVEEEIIFDEGQHSYHVGGIRRFSVTQILTGAGVICSDWWTEEARERGRIVHAATHYADLDDLDVTSVEQKHHPYISAWDRFKREARFTPDLIEHRIFHRSWGYCGTLDRTGDFDGGGKALIDLKTSSGHGKPENWWSLQLAAYVKALESMGIDTSGYRRINVTLHKDGTFKVHEQPTEAYRDAWNTFLCCLGVFNFKNGGVYGHAA